MFVFEFLAFGVRCSHLNFLGIFSSLGLRRCGVLAFEFSSSGPYLRRLAFGDFWRYWYSGVPAFVFLLSGSLSSALRRLIFSWDFRLFGVLAFSVCWGFEVLGSPAF